ncbi:hypothetical protein ABZ871_26775 [Streptomyces populi]
MDPGGARHTFTYDTARPTKRATRLTRPGRTGIPVADPGARAATRAHA